MSATTPPPVGTPTDSASSAIHDIGYRHYDGPRLGRGYIRRSLFTESARGAYGLGRTGRAKVVPMLLAIAMVLPALIIVVATAVTGAPELVGSYHAYVLNLQLVIMIYVAGQAPASVSRDLRFAVTPLYFSRPMERVDYVTAKFAAMAAAVFVLIATPLTVLFVGALLADLPLGEQLPDYLRALAGGAIVALLLAGIGLVIASITPRRGLGVAAVIAVLMVLAAVQGIAQGIVFEEGARTAAVYLGLVSPFTLVAGIESALLGSGTILFSPPTEVGQGLVFAGVAVLLIAGCYAALLRRYRKVSDS